MTAVHRGDVAKVREMLAHGAVASAANEFGVTSLHIAAEMGHHDVARVLCERGASACAKNANGETALHIAAREGDAALAALLLAHGASVTQADMWGRTAADLADELEDGADRFDLLQLLSRAAGADGARELRAGEKAQGLVMGVRPAQIAHVPPLPRAAAATSSVRGHGVDVGIGGDAAAPLSRALEARPAADGVVGLIVTSATASGRGTAVAIGTDSDSAADFHSTIELTPAGAVITLNPERQQQPAAAAGTAGALKAAGAAGAKKGGDSTSGTSLVSTGAGGSCGLLRRSEATGAHPPLPSAGVGPAAWSGAGVAAAPGAAWSSDPVEASDTVGAHQLPGRIGTLSGENAGGAGAGTEAGQEPEAAFAVGHGEVLVPIRGGSGPGLAAAIVAAAAGR